MNKTPVVTTILVSYIDHTCDVLHMDSKNAGILKQHGGVREVKSAGLELDRGNTDSSKLDRTLRTYRDSVH